MATYPLPTLGPTITATGISIPSFNDVYQSLIAIQQSIYGSDIYLAPDSQDGQWLAALAKVMDDFNQACVKSFNGHSPSFAEKAQLSALVKINGLKRAVPTNSTVNLTIVGQVGTIITNGIAKDESGNQWLLPASVTIPPAGNITVTATAAQAGTVIAPANSITEIANPQRGWQSVNNVSAATAGLPVEEDPGLRLRQSQSVSNPSRTIMEGIKGSILNLPGVAACKYYDNDTGSTDSNGIPAGNIAFVVQGGIASSIANLIFTKKTSGVPTYGSTTIVVNDEQGNPHNVKFSVPTEKRIVVSISLNGYTNYTTIIGDKIKQAVADFINSLDIADDVVIVRLQVPAQLYGDADSLNYRITTIQAMIFGGSLSTSDIAIAFNEIATCQVSDITINTV